MRFGLFEVDFRARELRRKGLRVKLQDQPFDLLVMLLEKAGEVVTREELKQRLWPSDVFVDFEQGLNKAAKKLRDALGDSAENPRFIETLHRRGYRFIAPVELLDGAATPPPERVSPATTARRRAVLWGGVAAVLLLIVGLGALLAGRSKGPPRAARAKLAILPFQNLSGNPDQDYLSDGLTEELTAQLSRISPLQLAVIARTSAMHYKGTPKRADQIGRELGVDYILEGSVRRDAERLRITAQLIQTKDETHLWAESYERDALNLFGIQGEVAQQVARALALELLTEHKAALGRPATLNQAAHDSYLRGRYHWNKRTEEGLHKSVAYFQQAIREDPAYAPGYSGLADAYNLLANFGTLPTRETLPKAKEAALTALSLDPGSAEAHASLGWARLVYDREWQAAERAFQRAIQLDPGYASAHQWYAYLLRALGRHDEALAEARRALEVDPRALILHAILGWHYYLARDYDRAIEQCRRTIEMEPGFSRVHSYLGWAYLEKGQHREALAELEKARALFGDTPARRAELARARAVAGQAAEARRMLRALEAESHERYVEPDLIAAIYAALGEPDAAFQWLERAEAERSARLVLSKVDPALDPLRSDPRFEALLRRIGFPPG